MKAFFFQVFILIVSLNSFGQDSIELFEETQFAESISLDYSLCSLSNEKIIVAFAEGGTLQGKLRIGSIGAENNIILGDNVTFYSPGLSLKDVKVTALTNSKFFITYANNSGFYIRAGKIESDNQIILGEQYPITTFTYYRSQTRLTDNLAIVAYPDYNNDDGKCKTIHIDENLVITFGSTYIFDNSLNTGGTLSIDALSDSTFAIAYGDFDGTAVVGSVDEDNVITFSEPYLFNMENSSTINVVGLNENNFAIAFTDHPNDIKYGTLMIGNINSSNEISYSNKYVFSPIFTNKVSILKLTSDKLVISFIAHDANNVLTDFLVYANITENNVEFSESVIYNQDTNSNNPNKLSKLDSERFVVQYKKGFFYGFLNIGELNEVLGIHSLEIEKYYTIYTDSVNRILNIELLKESRHTDLKLFNITGQLIHNNRYSSKNITIQTNNFQSGIYIIHLKNDKTIITKKLLIE